MHEETEKLLSSDDGSLGGNRVREQLWGSHVIRRRTRELDERCCVAAESLMRSDGGLSPYWPSAGCKFQHISVQMRNLVRRPDSLGVPIVLGWSQFYE
jgi:hypothetical protein